MPHYFKKGDYLVPLSDTAIGNNWNNWVLKQRKQDHNIRPEIDPNTGESDNSWINSKFEEGVDWRYATPSERSAYNQHGGPFKVEHIIQSSNYEIY
jgi:hypothetical protein